MTYYTMQQLADRIGVPYHKLRRWVAAGWVKPVAGNTEYIFTEAAVKQAQAVKDRPDNLLSPTEAMAYLGVGKRRFYEIVKQFHVRRKKLNERRVYYRKDELDLIKNSGQPLSRPTGRPPKGE